MLGVLSLYNLFCSVMPYPWGRTEIFDWKKLVKFYQGTDQIWTNKLSLHHSFRLLEESLLLVVIKVCLFGNCPCMR